MSEKSSNFAAAFDESGSAPRLETGDCIEKRASAIRHIPLEKNRQNFYNNERYALSSMFRHGRWGIVVGFAEPFSNPIVCVFWTH